MAGVWVCGLDFSEGIRLVVDGRGFDPKKSDLEVRVKGKIIDGVLVPGEEYTPLHTNGIRYSNDGPQY